MVTPAERTDRVEEPGVPRLMGEYLEAASASARETAPEDQYAAAELKRRHERTALMIRKAQEQVL